METAAVTDEELNAAAADAKKAGEEELMQEESSSEEIVDDSTTEDQAHEGEEAPTEFDEDGLPIDHGARSELGRKVAAAHRRMDEFGTKLGTLDSRLDKLLTLLEKQNSPEEEEIDPDMPLTYGEYQRLEQKREQERAYQQQRYNDEYISTISQLASDLDEKSAELIVAEMRDNVRYTPTGNAKEDARSNFIKATQLVLQKQTAAPLKKTNPLDKNEPRKGIGTIKSQAITKTNKPLPKLDAAAEDYLRYVASTRGEEEALKLRKGLAK